MELSIHHVTPEFVRAMRSLGVDGTDSPGGLVEMRIHGVTPEYVRGLRGAGLVPGSVQGLVALRNQGVTAELVREVALPGIRLDAEVPPDSRGRP